MEAAVTMDRWNPPMDPVLLDQLQDSLNLNNSNSREFLWLTKEKHFFEDSTKIHQLKLLHFGLLFFHFGWRHFSSSLQGQKQASNFPLLLLQQLSKEGPLKLPCLFFSIPCHYLYSSNCWLIYNFYRKMKQSFLIPCYLTMLLSMVRYQT